MLRCEHCGEPIGVYEPLIALVDGTAHETSRAAFARCDGLPTVCYHLACFERLQSGDTRLSA